MSEEYDNDINDLYELMFEIIIWSVSIILCFAFAKILLVVVGIGIFMSYKLQMQRKLLRKQIALLKRIDNTISNQPESANLIGMMIDKEI